MKRCAEFRKLVVDGRDIKELIGLEKTKGGFVVPAWVMEKLQLQGIELVEASDREILEYLKGKWK